MRTLGVDLSHWEGSIDWELAYPWMPFVYYKATDGYFYIDDQFANNRDGTKKYGVPNAPYHYWHPELDPIVQANHFIDTVGTGYSRYIVDAEDRTAAPRDIVARLKQFLDRCEELTGKKPAIYTSASYWNEVMYPLPSWSDDYDLIVANYTTKRNPMIPNGWARWKIWQFGDNFYMQGCDEFCDGDWFNGTLQECRDWFGNYHPYNAPPTPPGTGLKLRVLIDGLRIRKSPNIGAQVVGQLKQDEIIEAQNIAGMEAWVKHERGWSAAKRYGTVYMEKK